MDKINRNIVYLNKPFKSKNEWGFGERDVFFCNGGADYDKKMVEVVFAEILGSEQKKLTFVEPFGQAREFSELFKMLKKANPLINICVYTQMYLDYLYKLNDSDCLELLKYIDTLIDGKIKEGDKFNKDFMFRNSPSQRVIDMKTTNYFNDGYLRLVGYAHLRESNNTKYQFYLWLMAVNDWRAEECIKYICRFDEDMKITNNIDKMLDHMISLGTGRKMTSKFRYLYNRWCHRVDLKIPIHKDTGNPSFIDLHPVDNVECYRARRILIYFQELKRHENDIEKRRFPARPKPELLHNYKDEEISNRHKIRKEKKRLEIKRKTETQRRKFKKRFEPLNGLNDKMYSSSNNCKIFDKYRKRFQKNSIKNLLNN